jgi:protein-S-isoprenylcysteine O-methyltransferase Ste14
MKTIPSNAKNTVTEAKANARSGQWAARSTVVLCFVVALEFVIMISPFAFVFYAAMNPFLLALNQWAATRWLTAFFLPHMVVAPNAFLKGLRVVASWAFFAGMLVFVVCAAQVYLGKLFHPKVAERGLYRLVRHPQYVGLAVAAWGLAVMWPRFLTLTLFGVMLFLYYLLARDEERRMLNRFEDGYRAYLERTGMFVPRAVERSLGRSGERRPLRFGKAVAVLVVLVGLCVGSGFALRAYTVRHLPLAEIAGVDVLAITGEDLEAAKDLVPGVVADPAVAGRLKVAKERSGHRLVAYFLPIDYIMQGMIADTGPEWKLFQHHKTLRMIAEYMVHPFAHLTGGHHAHMAGMAMGQHNPAMHNSPMMKRRIIVVEMSKEGQALAGPVEDFGINVQRVPVLYVDVHLHTGEVYQVRELPAGSGWGTVPTPTF